MRAAPPPPAEPLEALAEREVAVVRRRIDLEQRLERLARALGLAGVEVRPAERLEDRALAGLEPVGPLEDDRGLGVVATLEQRVAALEEVVGALGSLGGPAPAIGSPGLHAARWSAGSIHRGWLHDVERARGDADVPATPSRYGARSTGLRRGRIGQARDPAALGDRLRRRSP